MCSICVNSSTVLGLSRKISKLKAAFFEPITNYTHCVCATNVDLTLSNVSFLQNTIP